MDNTNTMSDAPPPSQCPTPELSDVVGLTDVGVRLLGAIEKLVEKLDALIDAQFEEYEECPSEHC